jgi:hypothetical protein
MVLIKDVTDCSTFSVRGLDNQLIAQMNKICPGLLVSIAHLDVELGQAVHPWMQAVAATSLEKALASRNETMIINSAYRTLAGQCLLRAHYELGRCGIVAAAQPGYSNHNNASAIDIEDPWSWKSALESNGWRKLGSWDDMHYDHLGCDEILDVSVLAFQQLWNQCRPNDQLTEDGGMGPATLSRLRFAPAEGFPGVGIPRILRLTQPLQIGEDVGVLQLALRKAGIEIEKADKVFGSATHDAVIKFQEKSRLLADGIVGASTAKALGI